VSYESSSFLPRCIGFVVNRFSHVGSCFVDYINYEVASPSILAALGCVFSAILLVAVYEFKSFKANRKLVRDSKV